MKNCSKLNNNNNNKWSSHRGSAEINLASIHENASLILGLAGGVKDQALPQAAT